MNPGVRAVNFLKPKPDHGSWKTLMITDEDRKQLATLDAKMAVVRDRTRSVAKRYTTGFFLYGPGGCGKSYAVLGELDKLKSDYKLHNSRMTGRGLFDALDEFPDSIHVCEDMEQLVEDRMAQGVLRSALWGQERDGKMNRVVTWRSHKTNLRCEFQGGIIILSNRPLADLPELNAIGTRINPIELHVTNAEGAALMRQIAEDGHKDLSPDACREVAEYIIERSLAEDRRIDLRILLNAFGDRLQHDRGEAEAPWRNLVDSRLKGLVVPAPPRRSRAEVLDEERMIAREIKDLPRVERANTWHGRTGKSEKALYRRLAEI